MSPHHHTRIPHTTRPRSEHHPVHVVMTFRDGCPQPHWSSVREILFRWMREASQRYRCSINFAVAMPGHVHLIVETPRESADLGDVMRFLSSKLALEINRRWKRRGPVYRDRFFSRVMKTLSEVVRGIRYVAYNPVTANFCGRPEDWQASTVGEVLRGAPASGLWRFRGWMYRKLCFLDDPAAALGDILEGRRKPVVARGGRQLRLPFRRGLPGLS